MENHDVDDIKLGQAMQRLNNKNYHLIKGIKQPLQETFEKLCDEYGLLYEFMFIVILLIFSHIDLLGRLYAGEISNKNTTKNAIIFMREYLGKVDVRYKEVSSLLYHALRHGFVHLYTPKRIKLNNGEQLDFSFTTHHKKIEHLSLHKNIENEITGVAVIWRLDVHVSQLYEDLLIAIDKYAEDIFHDQNISDRFKKSFESRRVEDTEEMLIKKYAYLAMDFKHIYKQMLDS